MNSEVFFTQEFPFPEGGGSIGELAIASVEKTVQLPCNLGFGNQNSFSVGH